MDWTCHKLTRINLRAKSVIFFNSIISYRISPSIFTLHPWTCLKKQWRLRSVNREPNTDEPLHRCCYCKRQEASSPHYSQCISYVTYKEYFLTIRSFFSWWYFLSSNHLYIWFKGDTVSVRRNSKSVTLRGKALVRNFFFESCSSLN